MSSRTSEAEIQTLTNFYRIFHPTEISFILDLNSRLSKLEPTRITFISDHLQQLFKSQHKESDIRALLSFFSNPSNSVQITHNHDLRNLLLPHSQAHPLEPFTKQCPICHRSLTSENAHKKQVLIYTNNGQVLPGQYCFLYFLLKKLCHLKNKFLAIFLYNTQ